MSTPAMTSHILSSTAVLGLSAALLWGAGDFSGGMGAKRAGGDLHAALRVVLLSHGTSLTLLTAAALLRGDPLPHGAPVLWALGAGMTAGLSVTAFYVALAEGAMGSAAAISGLLAAAIPALASLAIEGAPSRLTALGFFVAAGAIWLIAAGAGAQHSTTSRRALLLAIFSGAGFGVYFVCLRMSSRAGLLWPMAGSRVGSLSVCLLGLVVLGVHARGRRADRGVAQPALAQPRGVLSRNAVLWALSTALFDTGGNLTFMAATRAGRLDVAAVLASLYPASTILLAAWVLRERPTLRQALGMVVAGLAVVLITL